MIKHENKDWIVSFILDWTLRKGVESSLKCTSCGGSGNTGNWGKMYSDDDDNTCSTCRGNGRVPNPALSSKPKFPPELEEYMMSCWVKYFKDEYIAAAIRIQKKEENKRYLYCVLSSITKLSYEHSKNLLQDCVKLKLIECDSEGHFGKLL